MFLLSFPTRERGLKYKITGAIHSRQVVVPHAGTWIEILLLVKMHL